MDNPLESYVPNAIGFLIFRSGFFSEGSVGIRVKDTHKFSKGIMYVKGNAVTLLHREERGDGVIVLPIFAKSNETLFDTFFELAISMKYFTLLLARNKHKI